MHGSTILPQIINLGGGKGKFNLETHLLLIDYENAFDNIQR